MGLLKERMTGAGDSPVMARAPLLLTESMLFPYREGLSFEQDIWMDQGKDAAFAGALDHPPSSTWEIINPRFYEAHKTPAIPLMPDIHPLVDKIYQPCDSAQSDSSVGRRNLLGGAITQRHCGRQSKVRRRFNGRRQQH